MSLRIPIQKITTIDTSLTGVVPYTVNLQQDVSSVTFKLQAGTFTGTSPTCDVYILTTDDGGVTFYDVAHFTQITGTISNAAAQFVTIPIDGAGTTSLGSGYIGSVSASTTSASKASGLPLLSQLVQIVFKYGGTVGVNAGVRVDVEQYSQANRS
jgi:hypothetical protein